MRPMLALILALWCQDIPEALRLPETEFARRRTEIVERFPDGAIAIDAGPLAEVGSDANTPVFDFKYLTGFHDPEGVLVLAGPKTAVFVSDVRKVPGIETVLRIGPSGGRSDAAGYGAYLPVAIAVSCETPASQRRTSAKATIET